MKIIINESQLRLIVENEGENLMDFTPFIDFNPNKWDDMFEHMNKKKGGIYDGYYINGDVDLEISNVTKLNYLVKVSGSLDLRNTQIESLPMLSYIGWALLLDNSQIKSLPKLEYVGGFMYLSETPLSKTTTKKELRKQINVKGKISL